jgi:hypothetical protein
MHVVFDVDERTTLRLLRFARDRKDTKVTVRLALTGDDGFPRTASVDFVDPIIDAKTGTLRVRAVLPNPKEEVRPGQFVRARVPLGDARKALLVPDQAVGNWNPDGHSVLVVNDKNVIEDRRVRIGLVVDGFVEIETGLKPDDRVVRNPARLRAGDVVKPQPAKEPAAKPNGLGLGSPPARPLPDLPGTGLALIVTATYPGANARVVEDTVAGPIDLQINGLEKLAHRLHACTDDGTMRMTLLFEPGTDLDKAVVRTQGRLALAEPTLPEEVRRSGITIRKKGVHLAAVAVISPNDQFDRQYLANYAKANLRDELARVPGVADAAFYGDSEPGRQVRLVIDRDKLAAMDLTITEVSTALRDLGLTVEAAAGRRPTVTITGRLLEPDQLKDVVVRAGKDGLKISLKDLAQVEVVEGWGATTALDGKACVLLLVSRLPDANPKETAKAIRDRVAELAKRLPEGLEIRTINERE